MCIDIYVYMYIEIDIDVDIYGYRYVYTYICYMCRQTHMFIYVYECVDMHIMYIHSAGADATRR